MGLASGLFLRQAKDQEAMCRSMWYLSQRHQRVTGWGHCNAVSSGGFEPLVTLYVRTLLYVCAPPVGTFGKQGHESIPGPFHYGLLKCLGDVVPLLCIFPLQTFHNTCAPLCNRGESGSIVEQGFGMAQLCCWICCHFNHSKKETSQNCL